MQYKSGFHQLSHHCIFTIILRARVGYSHDEMVDNQLGAAQLVGYDHLTWLYPTSANDGIIVLLKTLLKYRKLKESKITRAFTIRIVLTSEIDPGFNN